jgi:hypothetical protein
MGDPSRIHQHHRTIPHLTVSTLTSSVIPRYKNAQSSTMSRPKETGSLWATHYESMKPRSRNMLDVIPNELLEEILRHVVSSEIPNVFGLRCNSTYSQNAILRLEGIRTLCLVSRRFHKIAMPMLFERNWFLNEGRLLDLCTWHMDGYRDKFIQFKDSVEKNGLNYSVMNL